MRKSTILAMATAILSVSTVCGQTRIETNGIFGLRPAETMSVKKLMTDAPADRMAIQGSAERFAATAQDEIIREAPEGTRVAISASGFGYSLGWTGISFSYMSGVSKEAVYTDDAVYIKDSFLAFMTNSYLKAEKKDGKYTATLPVLIYEEESYGMKYAYYASILTKQITEDGMVSYVPSDETEVSFVENDGVLTLDLGYDPQPDAEGNIESPDRIFGLVDAQGMWSGIGDASQIYTPFTETAVAPSADIRTDKWALINNDSGRLVDVGFEGNRIWLKGLFKALPESWIYGEIEDNSIVLPSFQYVGTSSGYFVYLLNANISAEGYVTPVVSLPLDYDAEKKVITTRDPGDALFFNAGTGSIAYLEYIQNPRIQLQDGSESKAVQNPTGLVFNDYFDSMGMAFFDFVLPVLNPEGDLLDTSTMYYNILFDDAVETFYSDEYPDDVEDEITDIPFNFGKRNFWTDGTGKHEIVIFAQGLKSIGVQLFNRDGDKIYKSDIVTLVLPNGVDSIDADPEAVSTEWFDITGMKAAGASKGIMIKRVTYADGSVKTFKTIVK